MSAITNEIKRKDFNIWTILVRQFKNPLLLVFIIATVVSFLVGEKTEAFVIWGVMTLSVTLGFWNEFKAEKTVNDLLKRISFTVRVMRDGIEKMVTVDQIMIGDEVSLHPGSIIPADIKLLNSYGLEVNESALTGESLPVNKNANDMVFMGTIVTAGSANGTVIAIGIDTKYGKITQNIGVTRPETEFQKGLRDFSTLLAKIAGIAVVLVIIFGFFFHHPVIETVLFALTVAMGITPELLPLIVTLSLSYGARKMAKEKVIVKQFISIEDLGNMEVLCTDKTGTLTEGKISLSTYTDINGKKDDDIIRYGLMCNSGFKHKHFSSDSIDSAISVFGKKENIAISGNPEKLFEVPFNYENRFMSVVVKEGDTTQLICKGSPESILARCHLTSTEKSESEKLVKSMQSSGLRVIAVATKTLKNFDQKLINTVNDLGLNGFISFTDIPKKGLHEVFTDFDNLGIALKIITGDSEVVAKKVAEDAGFNYKNILESSQVAKMTNSELANVVWDTDIFAKITPSQKMRIIEALKSGGHTVGFLGDGINDAPALHTADVGISVNTGVDVAKDAASIVLLDKSLDVIADGVREGRKIFQNTIKFLLMGTSSDFGNMISAAVASIALPFLPMTPVQFLLNDVLYDVSQMAIPTDNVDAESVQRPKNWDIKYIKRFMLFFGPISTVYDLLTFGVMYFVFSARGSMFQTGWFIESLITEILVVFVIRTQKIPFWKSKPSPQFLVTCTTVVILGIYLPFSPIAWYFGFTPLPALYFGFLIGITLTYLVFVEIGKHFLNKNIT